jgi:hypothetical protein
LIRIRAISGSGRTRAAVDKTVEMIDIDHKLWTKQKSVLYSSEMVEKDEAVPLSFDGRFIAAAHPLGHEAEYGHR